MKKLYTSIIKAGLLAGTLDILAAITSYYLKTGKGPEGVFRFIASGYFGTKAFKDDTEYMLAGIVFHYLIAFGFTIAFFLVYPYIRKWVSAHIIITGLVYGLIAWCIMNLLVIPASKAPSLPFDLQQVITGILFLMLFIGLPIAIVSKKHYQ